MEEQVINELQLLYREAYFAKSQYILLINIYNDIISENNNFNYLLSSLFDAVEFSVLLKLTNIFDRDKQSITLRGVFSKIQCNINLNNNNIAIKNFTSNIINHLDSMEPLIEKINIYRTKVVSHLDKKYPKGLLSIKSDEIINFQVLEELSNFAYDNIKQLYELTTNETLLDTKQFDILQLEYEHIKDKIIN